MVLQHNFIDEISPNKETWRIKVRIIRMWKRPSFNNPNEDNSIDMVFMDEKGKTIEATVRRSLIKRFSSQIVEGEFCTITNFDVGQNSGDYRAANHPYKINFLFSTSIKGCDVLNIPLYGFNFIPFDDILASRMDEKFLIDIIGEVVGVGSIQTSNKDGKQLTRLEVELEDLEKKKLKCTLWGKFAEQMSSYVADGNSPIILIMQFAKIKINSWNGEINLSNTMFSTRLFINDDMDDITEYKHRLGNNGVAATQRLTQLTTQTQSSTLDDLFTLERKFVTEIREIREKCCCVTLATIVCIQTEYNWFYPACKCNRKVEKDDDGQKYHCKKCGHVKFVIPRYKVQVRVVDETGSASFVMFDKHVTPVVHKSAYNLMESLTKIGDTDAFPEELNVFVGKKFIFVVEISDYNLEKNWPIYTIVRMTDDEDTIKKIVSSSATNQDKEGDGCTSNEADSNKLLNNVEKDSVSYIGDNDYQSDFCLSSPLGKRTFETSSDYVGDNDDANVQSSTNKKKAVVKIEKEND